MELPEIGDNTKPLAIRVFCAALVGTTPVSFTLSVLVVFAGSEAIFQVILRLLAPRVLWLAVVPLAAVNSTLESVAGQNTSPLTLRLLCATLVLFLTV